MFAPSSILLLLLLFLQYTISASVPPPPPPPPTDVFAFGCYSWTQAGPTDKPLTSCPPAVVFSYLYYSKCLCDKMVDVGGFTYLNCTSYAKPPDTSFTSLCTYTQINEENTCSSITDINNISTSACSGVPSISAVTGSLCSNKQPTRKVVDVLNRFGIGRLVVNMLDVACGANATKLDVSAICTGIGTLSKGCSTNSTSSTSALTPPSIHLSISFAGVILMTILALFI